MFIAIYEALESRNFVASGLFLEQIVETLQIQVNEMGKEDFEFERVTFYSANEVNVERNISYTVK